jgi:hypothetical protein
MARYGRSYMPSMQVHKTFASLQELFVYAKRGNYNSSESRWAGGDIQSAVESARAGTLVQDRSIKAAMSLMEKIDASFRDRETQAWLPSIAGAYPIVPEWLMGRFDSMRARTVIETDVAPVRIFCEVSVSAGVSHEELERRGTAMAALVTRMSEERPVELHMFSSMYFPSNETTVLWNVQLDSHPVSLNQVLMTFAETAFIRAINFSTGYGICKENGRSKIGSSIGWGYGAPSNGGSRENKLRELMELQPKDVLIQGGYLPDAALMNSDPVAWVHKQLEQQRTITEE